MFKILVAGMCVGFNKACRSNRKGVEDYLTIIQLIFILNSFLTDFIFKKWLRIQVSELISE